jgi:hypothetical protein
VNRRLMILWTFGFSVLVSSLALAAAQVDADAVLEKLQAAHGGQALLSIKNLVLGAQERQGNAGVTVQTLLAIDLVASRWQLTVTEPRTRLSQQLRFMNGAYSSFDGRTRTAMSNTDARAAVEFFYRGWINLRIDRRQRSAVRYLGVRTWSKVSGSVLMVTTAGSTSFYLLDKAYRILAERQEREEASLTYFYGRYQRFGELIIPTSWTVVQDQKTVGAGEITRFLYNTDVGPYF